MLSVGFNLTVLSLDRQLSGSLSNAGKRRKNPENCILTGTAYSSIEFESCRNVERHISGRDPLASVGRQLTALHVSIVQKPTAHEVVGFRAQLTTYRPCCIAHFDYVETSGNHCNAFVQQVLVTSCVCHKSVTNYDNDEDFPNKRQN